MPARLSDILQRDLDADPEILGVTADSRKVKPGFLFAALPGAVADGRTYAAQAAAAGAAAILAPSSIDGVEAPVVVADAPRRAHALAAV